MIDQPRLFRVAAPRVRQFVAVLRRLSARARAHPLPALLWATVAVSVFFLLFPAFDVWVSSLYFDGQGFAASDHPFLVRLRGLGPFFVWLIALGSGIPILAKLIDPDRPALFDLRAPLFLLTTLALGPGLLVNGILKAWSGRPRPRYIEAFGGELPYVPVWRFTDHCASNCSFVSGEGASAAWLVALALVLPLTWRRPAVFIAVALGAALSFNRVAFGGHFLSDTLLAWCLMGILITLLYRLFYQVPPAVLQPARLDHDVGRLGRQLREIAGDAAFALRQRWRRWRQ